MRDFFSSIRLCVLSLAVCSIGYPALVLLLAMIVAPQARQGSLLHAADGTLVGSRLIAQSFTRPEYFWSRPSAVGYDAAAAGGSNLSPTNPALGQQAADIVARLKLQAGQVVPADLVSASGSGLDPHITLSAAMLQVARVAEARGRSAEQIELVVRAHVDSPTLVALGGEPLVNVLELNLALDRPSTP